MPLKENMCGVANMIRCMVMALAGLLYGCHSKESTSSLLDLTVDTTRLAAADTVQKQPIQQSNGPSYGADISHFQGDLLEKLPKGDDGLHFIICKATQGDSYVDPDFYSNWREIKEEGMIRGTYHFYMCADGPQEQAEHFVSTVQGLEPTDLPLILDIEQGSMSPKVSPEQMEQDILVFLKALEQRTGRKPILYTDYAFANEYLKDTALVQYDLWLAEYSGGQQPRVPQLWKEKGFKIWQKSDAYDINSERVDYDVYFGAPQELLK